MAALALALAGAVGAVVFAGAPWLLLVDAAGLGLLGAWVHRAGRRAATGPRRLVLDALIAWPGVTALVAWLAGAG